jgi:pimeloyl-ACP methyl ester carboxylesterase
MKHPEPKPLVVLIHGLSAHWLLMSPLSWYLRRSGFATKLFGYRSMWGSLERHANRFRMYLDELDRATEYSEVHIVAHSAGAIVTRQALLDSKPGKVSRVVMLGPPNRGSPVARCLSRYVLPFSCVLEELSDSPTSFVNQLPEPDGFEIGVLAALHDRVVPHKNSRLATQSDHLSIFSGHNGLLVRPHAMKCVVNFLKTGHFLRLPVFVD